MGCRIKCSHVGTLKCVRAAQFDSVPKIMMPASLASRVARKGFCMCQVGHVCVFDSAVVHSCMLL